MLNIANKLLAGIAVQGAFRVTPIKIEAIDSLAEETYKPDHWITCSEESQCIHDALVQIPTEQREVIVLHLFGSMKFREIAKLKTISFKTAQSRYRYGLEKLRLQLNGELKK